LLARFLRTGIGAKGDVKIFILGVVGDELNSPDHPKATSPQAKPNSCDVEYMQVICPTCQFFCNDQDSFMAECARKLAAADGP
jgi:hypothetical protein